MAELITGSCNCGRHKYTAPKPEKFNLCHCTNCRAWAGAMHSAHLFTDAEQINSHGSPEPRTHVMIGDDGTKIERAWCDQCGCGIWIRPGVDSKKTYLKAGLFKPQEIPNPSMEVYLKNLEPWETPAKGTEYSAQKM